ncbi:GNAT family N-acetyltransferase [bacterium]|nr:GNAT family N-acetyltransferase [bacterium]
MTSPNFRIVNADEAGLAALCDGFNRGFRDYKYSSFFDPPGMERFLERSAMHLEDCAVMLVEEDGVWQGVGAALLAIENDEAWCGGLAVDLSRRRRGGAYALMRAIHTQALRRGARKILLEVLMQNEAARALYRQLGYQEQRELLIWERVSGPDTPPTDAISNDKAILEPILEPVDALDMIYDCYHWHDGILPWQRRRQSLIRAYPVMDALALIDIDGKPVGYALYHHNDFAHSGERENVHLLDIAVAPGADMSEHGYALVTAFVARFPAARIVLVNEPVESVLSPALAAGGFQVADRQFELICGLDPMAGG